MHRSLLAAVLASVGSAALAQGTEPPAAASGLGDIVVTATRREEKLQDVAVSVTAVGGETLGAASTSNIRNVAQMVPGFIGGRNSSVTLPVIRGVGSTGVSVGDESNVATYIDGIYQADPWSTSLELVEVERVEVLRGPQGTVFGRNATGGLINVITPDPSFDFRGRLSGRYGRYQTRANDYDVRAYLTGGLSDTVAMDVAGLYRNNNGFLDDRVSGGRLGGARLVNVRSKLLFEPSDAAKIVLSGEYSDLHDQANAWMPYRGNTAGKRFPGGIVATGPWTAALGLTPAVNYERYNLALRTQFRFDGFNLETSTGYMHSKNTQFADVDASNILLNYTRIYPDVETISQEIRLLSAGDGPLNWIAGAYGFRLKATMPAELGGSNGPGTPVVVTNLDPWIRTTSYAGFVEGTYALGADLFLTGGGRFTTEKREFEQTVNGRRLPFGRAERTFNKWTYKVALRYNFADRANLYGSIGTGFKSGVYNVLGTSPAPTNPENITAYEVGLKADPLSWLRTNASIYYYDYKDLQVTARASDGLSFVLQNAATAEIYGGELELTAAPVDRLTLKAALAYNHADYKHFPAAQVFIPLAQGGNQVTQADASGNQLGRAPRFTLNLSGSYDVDVGGGVLSLNGNIYHSTKIYYDFANLADQPAYTMANGEIWWGPADAGWKVGLWVVNLTNAKVVQQLQPGPVSTTAIYEKPRRVGVSAQIAF